MLSPALLTAFLLYTHLLSVLDVGKSGLQSSVQCYSGVSVGFFLLVLAVEVIHMINSACWLRALICLLDDKF